MDSANCSTFHTVNSNQQDRTNKDTYNEQDLFGELYDSSIDEGRTFSVSNISLVITYVTFIVGLTMLAGFIWLAFSANGGSGNSYDSYDRKDFSGGISDWLFSGNNFFSHDGNYKRHKRSNSFESRDRGIIGFYF